MNDFFLGFAGHAHTMNELELDHQKELELRKRNSPEEAQELIGLILDKLEKDLLSNGHYSEDIKLLILFSSYRGDSEEKDALVCESVLRSIESRFRKGASSQPRLIGHTTAAELENEDLKLKQISGVGFNGFSLLTLVTDLPIGVGRTWGLRTPQKAGEQGQEMAHDAWIDLSHQARSKEELHMGKTMLVLAQGSSACSPGYEHFLAEGIGNFMGSTREARIMNVIGGCSGDGLIAQSFHQFYGRMKEHSASRALEGEAVCALIPNLCETSLGLDTKVQNIIGKEHTFRFNPEKEPHYKYVKLIDDEAPSVKYIEAAYENELRLAKEKGLPAPDEKTIQAALQEAIDLSRAQKTLLVFNPVSGKYAFAFPFGNYTCAPAMRVVGEDFELMFPIRSFVPEMTGYFVTTDYEKIQKGARGVLGMLRSDQAFNKNDATFLVSCVNRRLAELMTGCRSETEAGILKEGLSSSQVIGFLGNGEMSFTNLIQEPFTYALSLWGMTFRSKSGKTKSREKEGEHGIKSWIKGKT